MQFVADFLNGKFVPIWSQFFFEFQQPEKDVNSIWKTETNCNFVCNRFHECNFDWIFQKNVFNFFINCHDESTNLKTQKSLQRSNWNQLGWTKFIMWNKMFDIIYNENIILN